MMKIAFATDLHDSPRTMEWLAHVVGDHSLVIIGGDVGDIGSMDSILEFAKSSPRPVIIVPGNHDIPMSSLWSGGSVLHIAARKVGRYLIGGLGGSLPVQGAAMEFDETEYMQMAKSLGPVDILVTHQPPFGTKCSLAYDGTSETGLTDIGSITIRKYIEDTKPRLVLCGHVHESPAVDAIGDTVVVNPGSFLSGSYAEVDITPSKVRAEILNMTGKKPLTSYK
ncbi:MAG: metallophosphoesterase family protein [Nitrososphaerota archaeon]|jgi:Icc-related predicted phosphoesterase|nr:metallophosphoesterase family protein [Nitrososphaerota archaeon]MDG6948858.1 metallophosphoesterase family protein [Nitrososphaerota archaeon]